MIRATKAVGVAIMAAIAGSLIAFAILAAGLACLADTDRLSGTATASDGDTLRVAGVPVRLQGIAAPEIAHPGLGIIQQTGGVEARHAMAAIVAGRVVVCDLTAERTHGRRVGRCAVDGGDLGEAMIRAGLARRCARFDPDGRYAGLPENPALPSPAYCEVPH